MNSAAVLAAGALGNVPTTFSIALVGDYDGNGTSDLLWRDTSGNTSLWFMNGTPSPRPEVSAIFRRIGPYNRSTRNEAANLRLMTG
jgi:hypothetical protein